MRAVRVEACPATEGSPRPKGAGSTVEGSQAQGIWAKLSEKLNVIAHFIRHKDLADQHQTLNDISNRHPAMGIDNAGM